MIINGLNMPNFKKDEFPKNELEYVHINQLEKLQQFRTILRAIINPSKAKGSLSRLSDSKNSDHRVIIGERGQLIKPSTGTDVFCNTSIFKAWTVATTCGLWNSVGVYFDTNNNDGDFQPMLHLGLRSYNAIWFRHDHVYYSPNKTKNFYDRLKGMFDEYNIIAT